MAKITYTCYGQSMDASFEWNQDKDAENQRKHGVSFVDAQQAFMDPLRVIARDAMHSGVEARFYCFGRTATGILTVRFTWRQGVIRIIGAGYWRRGKKIYETQRKI